MDFCFKNLILQPKKPVFVLAVMLSSPAVKALEFGIYDSRALAMGGVSVATATAQHAHHYNPALLSMYEGNEDETRNGGLFLSSIVQASNSIDDLIDVLEDDLDGQLVEAIDNYNLNTSTGNAGSAASASRELQDAIFNLDNESYDGEAYVGLSVSVPSDRAGGSFYFGIRTIVGATTAVTEDDISLLDDYIEEFESVAGGASPGTAHPELYNDDGALTDPSDQVESNANVTSLAIAEWGVAASKEFDLWGQYVSLGITPKVMRVDVYNQDIVYGDGDYDYERDKRTEFGVNADIGFAMQLGEHVRIGVATKDLIPQSFRSGSGVDIDLKSRSRFGAAYTRHYFTLGFDLDLQENKALGSDRVAQDAALGLELRPLRLLALRMGYRQDLKGFRGSVLSGGAAIQLGIFNAELSVIQSDDIQGLSGQLGWVF